MAHCTGPSFGNHLPAGIAVPEHHQAREVRRPGNPMNEVWTMERVLKTRYVYDQNGRQEFVIEVYRDGDSFVGRGLSVRGEPITGDLRVSAQMEELARI